MIISPSLLNDYCYCKNTVFWIKNDINKIFNENMFIGNLYENISNKIRFDEFEIDIKNKYIIEYKKNTKHEGSKFQLLYYLYLYLLKEIYKDYKGKIIYIEKKEEQIIELNYITKIELLTKLAEIELFLKNINFDSTLISKKCKGCRFEEICFL